MSGDTLGGGFDELSIKAKNFLAVVEEVGRIDLAIAATDGEDLADQQFFGEGEVAGAGAGIFCIAIGYKLVDLEAPIFSAMVLGTLGLMGLKRFGVAMHSYVSVSPAYRPSQGPDRIHAALLLAYTDGAWYQKLVAHKKEDEAAIAAAGSWCTVDVTPGRVGRPYKFLVTAAQIVDAKGKMYDPERAREGLGHVRKMFAATILGALEAGRGRPH